VTFLSDAELVQLTGRRRKSAQVAALRIEVTPAVQSVLDRIAARQREARISDLADLAIVQDAGAYASAYRRLGWTDLQSAVRHAGQQLARALPA